MFGIASRLIILESRPWTRPLASNHCNLTGKMWEDCGRHIQTLAISIRIRLRSIMIMHMTAGDAVQNIVSCVLTM